MAGSYIDWSAVAKWLSFVFAVCCGNWLYDRMKK